MLVRERKDPENQLNFLPICEECNEGYILKQVITPFYRNCEKLRSLAASRQTQYHSLGAVFNQVYGDVQTKNHLINERTLTTEQRIEIFDKNKLEINQKINEVSFKIKEYLAKDAVMDEEIIKRKVLLDKAQQDFQEKRSCMQRFESDLTALDNEVEDMKIKVEQANAELLRERENILNKSKQRLVGARESVFSNNYAVQIVQGERRTLLRATVPPKQNGSLQQTKPYCILI